MAYCVIFRTQADDTEVTFGNEWEAVETFKLSKAAVEGLGKALMRLPKGIKKVFLIPLEEKEGGLTVYLKRSWYRRNPLLRFEFDSIHHHYKLPCHNRFDYRGFSLEELSDFGKQLTKLFDTGYAAIGDTNSGFKLK